MPERIQIRRAKPEDSVQIVELLRSALGWGNDPRLVPFFEWKHLDNPFGQSPAWIAVDSERVVAFRAMLRWEFEFAGETVRAVRPVDTATHPEYRRQGLFSRLTTHALYALADDRVDIIFNTPNRASRAGYLQMGWHDLGRLGVRVRPTRPWRAVRMLWNRVAADRWPADTPVGTPAGEVLTDHDGVGTLIGHQPPSTSLRTRITPEFLKWRYGYPPLGYRAIVESGGPESGLAIFRLRHRGDARELVLSEALVPQSAPARTAAALVGKVMTAAGSDVDYAIQLASSATSANGRWWPLPRQGPVLVARTLSGAEPRPLGQWALTLGDIELL